jgi:hypothetical protein
VNKEDAIELERRLQALESGSEQGNDFDGRSWFWMVVLGVVLPIGLLLLGANLT